MRNSVIILLCCMAALVGCTGGNGSGKHVPQASDTLYTEGAAMSIHRTEPERALVMIDSAVTVGNITWQRGEYLKAVTQYGGMHNQAKARQLCLDLLAHKDALTDSVSVENTYLLLTSIEYTGGNAAATIRYATETSRLAHALDMPGDVGQMAGMIAYSMAKAGKTDEGVGQLRQTMDELRRMDSFQGVTAYHATAKSLMHILVENDRFEEMVPVCEGLLQRFDELATHTERFSGLKEGFDVAEFVDYARGQTLAFLTTAYARQVTAKPAESAHFLAKAREADAEMRRTQWSHSRDCDRMMTSALYHMGEWQRFDETFKRVDASMRDTLNASYLTGLEIRSNAARKRGRMAEALDYLQRAYTIRDTLDRRNQNDQLNELATVYHLQEEQLARQEAEADARLMRWITGAIVVGLLTAVAFAFYFFYKRRETNKKNRALVSQIREAIAYKEKYEALRQPAQQQPEVRNAASQEQPAAGPQKPSASPQATKDVEENPAAELYEQLRDAILRDRLYLNPQLDRQMLVDRFGLSKERIGAAFAKGSPYKSLIDFLTDCRLPHAAKLLAERPDLTIADVARESGFPSADTFGRNFRQKYALTPSQFREQQAATTD